MEASTFAQLQEINRRFYQEYAGSFAATRRRLQPGVRRLLGELPPGGRWLDLGCGSGMLAHEWARYGRTGLYWGLDFSEGLLEEARQLTAKKHAAQDPALQVRFDTVDLTAPDWAALLKGEHFDGVLAFASLHHVPSTGLRLAILRQIRSLIKPGGWFMHSEWQLQNSPKQWARRKPWSLAGIDEHLLDEGDTLLDWREPQTAAGSPPTLRYVHIFSRLELAELAEQAGFRIIEEFYSDGEGGRQGLYQIWQ